MKNKIKCFLTFVLTFSFIFGFSVWSLIKPDKDISITERRPLKQFPSISFQTINNRTFMTDFESYALDQFPLRDEFRGLKSFTSLKLLRQKNNNDLFLYKNHIFKLDYPLSIDSIHYASKVFSDINEQYLTKNNKIYLSVIPDKNYYISNKNGKLLIDYNVLIETIKSNCDFAEYIDISNMLSLEDYYRTDSHWKQENIVDVADKLLDSMDCEYSDTSVKINKADNEFYGVYHGQLALSLPNDEIYYLTDKYTENTAVFNYETKKYESVYNFEKLYGKDPYEIYLSGPVSLLTLENNLIKNGKELIVFRDSFTSSIAPLMLKGYSKITLVDIRYLQSKTIGQYISFDNQDVLFMYSSSVLNNSATLK